MIILRDPRYGVLLPVVAYLMNKISDHQNSKRKDKKEHEKTR